MPQNAVVEKTFLCRQNVQCVAVGVPYVKGNGQMQFVGNFQLSCKNVLLYLSGGNVVKVIQSDFPYGNHFGVLCQGNHFFFKIDVETFGVVGVHSHSGENTEIFLCQPCAFSHGGQIATVVYDKIDVVKRKIVYYLFPHSVKLGVVQMQMAVYHVSALPFRFPFPFPALRK